MGVCPLCQYTSILSALLLVLSLSLCYLNAVVSEPQQLAGINLRELQLMDTHVAVCMCCSVHLSFSVLV